MENIKPKKDKHAIVESLVTDQVNRVSLHVEAMFCKFSTVTFYFVSKVYTGDE